MTWSVGTSVLVLLIMLKTQFSIRKLSFKVKSQEKKLLLKGYFIMEEKNKSKELTLNAAALNCGTELNA